MKKLLLSIILITITVTLFAQHNNSQLPTSIRPDGQAPDPSAILDVDSDSKGVLVPRVSAAQMNGIAVPATGLLVYNTTDNAFFYYDGTTWTNLSSAGSGGGPSDNIVDGDSDTKIQVEESIDDDFLRFDVEGAETMVIKPNSGTTGKVGIGINNPQTPLHVETSGQELLRLKSDNTSSSWMGFHKNNPINGNTAIGTIGGFNTTMRMATSNNNTGGDIALATHNSGSPVDRLNITSDGKIGINNPTPQTDLDVAGRIKLGENNLFGTVDGSIRFSGTDFEGYDNGSWHSFTQSSPSDHIIDGDSRVEVSDPTIGFYLDGSLEYRVEKNAASRPRLYSTDNTILLGNGAGGDGSGSTNIFIGRDAGLSSTSANRTVAIGYEAMKENADRSWNTAIGYQALMNNSLGASSSSQAVSNTALGSQAGLNNTTGDRNVFIGSASGYDHTTGRSNTFVGTETGRLHTTGSNNAFFGRSTGKESTTGSNNTFLGSFAGYNNNSGTGNVFLGYSAGYNEAGNNRLYVSNSNTASPLLYGEFDGGGLLQVNGTFNINGNYDLPNTAGTTNQILSTNSSGQLVWVDPPATGTSYWNSNPGGIDYLGGDVGIGIPAFGVKLAVAGGIQVDDHQGQQLPGIIKYDGDFKGYDGSNWVSFTATGGGGGGGQWNTDSNGINYNSGNVGIGTTSSLDNGLIIETGATAPAGSISSGLRVSNEYLNTSGFKFGLRAESTGAGSSESYGVYSIAKKTNSSESGKLFGVSSKIDAQGAIGSTYGFYHDIISAPATSANHYGLASFVNGSNHYAVFAENNDLGGYAGYFRGRSYFSNEAGFGTVPDPNNQLTIRTTKSKAAYIENDYSGTSITYGVRVKTTDRSSGIKYGIYSEATSGSNSNATYGVRGTVYSNSLDGNIYGVRGSAIGSASGDKYAVHANSPGLADNEWGVYSQGRNYFKYETGIGTTDIPAGYELAVDGKIIAEEVQVQLESNWPDYVFESDYNLLPIDELKKEIEKQGHLPNIPSAKQVEEEGVAVGEMQRKMMEKIEELTLYIIQLKGEIDNIKQQKLSK